MTTHPQTTLRQALLRAATQLGAYLNNPLSGSQEAHWILGHVLSMSYTQLLTQSSRLLTADELQAYTDLVKRRVETHVPLAYILGTAPFCGLTLAAREPILIPRHETEEWVTLLITLLSGIDRPLSILDLCTGSGCIALALAFHLPHARVVGSDINPAAIALAEENKETLGLTNVTFVHSDLFENLGGHVFDLIVSNPPYLTPEEWNDLTQDVKNWESPLALIGGTSGLELYESILEKAPAFLSGSLKETSVPELVVEHGAGQSESVASLLPAHGFGLHTKWRDSFKNHRAIFANQL